MRQTQDPIALLESTKLLEAAFIAAATDIVTCAGNGWVTGDKLYTTTSGADLPAGLAISTPYYWVRIDADTGYFNSKPGDSSADRVDITDAGTGTHTLHLKSRIIDVEDFKNIQLSLYTASSANFTSNVQGSAQVDVDFEAAASATNRWDYIQMVDLEDGSTDDGDTGFAPAGTDDNREFEVNVNGLKWVCIDISAWTAGTLDARVISYSD